MPKIISWANEDSSELPSWYRLDEENEGNRFFQNLLDNAETDGRETFAIKEVSDEEWAEAEKIGKENS